LTTDCTAQRHLFQGPGRREIVASFDGGRISSDGGVVLLREVDRKLGVIERFAECFVDHRSPESIEHPVEDLLRQRVFGLALGYEDLVDHDELRRDALLAACVGKQDPTGRDRKRERDRGSALAGKSTLNRLEWGLAELAAGDRYHRIAVDTAALDRFFVELFLDSYEEVPERIILDFDATDDPLHGAQEGRFFHGYYDCYCYLPLYVFSGKHLLCARLRRSNIDASAGSVEELARLVAQIRERFPEVSILVRADSGFAREAIMVWCEEHAVDYVFGLARNPRLEEYLAPALTRAEELCHASGLSERVYEEMNYQTRSSWSRLRRVVGKAEWTPHGSNPRFVVTSLASQNIEAQQLYEAIYCARGEAENRIKEQQLDLFATRTSGHLMRVNQIRLWLSSVAYVLVDALRRVGLAGTELANAYCGTIRTRLLKIGARVRVSVRRVWVSLASSHPAERVFAHAVANLRRAGP
jgi:Transposase DDE domain group 1